jgi:hypothetical protein
MLTVCELLVCMMSRAIYRFRDSQSEIKPESPNYTRHSSHHRVLRQVHAHDSDPTKAHRTATGAGQQLDTRRRHPHDHLARNAQCHLSTRRGPSQPEGLLAVLSRHIAFHRPGPHTSRYQERSNRSKLCTSLRHHPNGLSVNGHGAPRPRPLAHSRAARPPINAAGPNPGRKTILKSKSPKAA